MKRGPYLDLRCRAEHKTGLWPGIARCVLNDGHTLLSHEDAAGRLWVVTHPEGVIVSVNIPVRRPSLEPGRGRVHNL